MTRFNFLPACWWAFIIVWALCAFSVKPVKERHDRAGRRFTLAFLAATFLLLDPRIHWFGMDARLWPYTEVVAWSADALAAIGLAVAVWARLALGSNWSGTVVFREGHELVERGPYRFVRHPIYTGLLLMVVGTALALGSVAGLIAVVICFLGHWWKLKREEALLTKHFPDSYAQYKSRTKALVPFIF